MDGDLQDPPEVLPQFVERWREGNDVVYAVRRHRKEGLAQAAGLLRLLPAPERDQRPRHSARQRRLLPDGPQGGGRAQAPARADAVRPGPADFVGFRQVGLAYERAAREAGRPKYTFGALVGWRWTAWSASAATRCGWSPTWVWPRRHGRWSCWSGSSSTPCTTRPRPRGWASTIVVVLFMGSVQLISLGIIGEYIRLIFLEAKGGPTYIVGDYTATARPRP